MSNLTDARADAQTTVTLVDLRAQIVFGLSELVALAGEPLAGSLEQAAAFDDPGLSSWVQAGLDDSRVKMIVGVRGANKTGILRAVRAWLRTRGIEEARLVDIDFEDVRFRHLETMEDVLDVLRRLPPCACPRFLFLDEIGRIGRHVELHGAASDYEAARTALNELYLTLRQTYDKVYTPRGKDADFLTFEANGTPRFWFASLQGADDRAFFRPGWGGGGYLRKRAKSRLK